METKKTKKDLKNVGRCLTQKLNEQLLEEQKKTTLSRTSIIRLALLKYFEGKK